MSIESKRDIIRRLLKSGADREEIEAAADCTEAYVYKIRRELKDETNKKTRAEKMLREKESTARVAAAVGLSANTVRRYKRALGFEPPKRRPYSQTLCWRCRNAVPDIHGNGCSWSRHFRPVKGWDAEMKPINVEPDSQRKKEIASYVVRSCPEFKPDERRKRAESLEEKAKRIRGGMEDG